MRKKILAVTGMMVLSVSMMFSACGTKKTTTIGEKEDTKKEVKLKDKDNEEETTEKSSKKKSKEKETEEEEEETTKKSSKKKEKETEEETEKTISEDTITVEGDYFTVDVPDYYTELSNNGSMAVYKKGNDPMSLTFVASNRAGITDIDKASIKKSLQQGLEGIGAENFKFVSEKDRSIAGIDGYQFEITYTLNEIDIRVLEYMATDGENYIEETYTASEDLYDEYFSDAKSSMDSLEYTGN